VLSRFGELAVDLRTVWGDDILRMRNKEIEMTARVVKFIVLEKCLHSDTVSPIAVFDNQLDATQWVDRLIDETVEELYAYKIVDVRHNPTDLWY
jgi:hypothetical protein